MLHTDTLTHTQSKTSKGFFLSGNSIQLIPWLPTLTSILVPIRSPKVYPFLVITLLNPNFLSNIYIHIILSILAFSCVVYIQLVPDTHIYTCVYVCIFIIQLLIFFDFGLPYESECSRINYLPPNLSVFKKMVLRARTYRLLRFWCFSYSFVLSNSIYTDLWSLF